MSAVLKKECPMCESDKILIKEWSQAYTVTINGEPKFINDAPQSRPRAKCLNCQWSGFLPLAFDHKED